LCVSVSESESERARQSVCAFEADFLGTLLNKMAEEADATLDDDRFCWDWGLRV